MFSQKDLEQFKEKKIDISRVEEQIENFKKGVKNPRILEIGMGTGTLTEHLLKLNYKELNGIEPENVDYEFLKKKFVGIESNKFEIYNSDIWNFNPKIKYDIIITLIVKKISQ